jgi:hypothetical protein
MRPMNIILDFSGAVWVLTHIVFSPLVGCSGLFCLLGSKLLSQSKSKPWKQTEGYAIGLPLLAFGLAHLLLFLVTLWSDPEKDCLKVLDLLILPWLVLEVTGVLVWRWQIRKRNAVPRV